MRTTLAFLLCGPFAMGAAWAQGEAASALAECQAHQQRLADLESNDMAPAQAAGSGTGWRPQSFGTNEIERERDLVDQTCAYARSLSHASSAPAPARAPAPQSFPTFRSDEPAAAPPPVAPYTPASAPAPSYASPQVAAPPPPSVPPQAPRQIIRRPPPPPPPPSVGGTKARHPADETPQQPPSPPQ